MKAPISENEPERLAALRGYDILDTPPEEMFDRVTRIAAAYFNVPTALISLLDETRQWFKSRHGLDAEETSRDIAFCAHAILADDILVVDDASKDRRFLDNPLVTGPPNVRFYAGAPLTTQNGLKLGTLCVIDYAPQKLTKAQEQVLADLAQVVVDQLELRMASKKANEETALRRRLEEERRESEARYRDMTEAGSDWVWEMGADLRFSYFSDSFLDIAGVEPNALIGKSRRDLAAVDEDPDKWDRHIDDLEHFRPFRDFQYEIVRPDGTTQYIKVNGKPVFDKSGNFSGYRGTGTNVTSQVEAENALKESEEKLAVLLNLVPAAINVKDLNGRYLLLNREHQEAYGIDAESSIGKTSHVVSQEHGQKIREMERRLLASEQPLIEFEHSMTDARGNVRDMLVRKAPLKGPSNETTGIITVSHDITERKQAEGEIRKLNEHLEQRVEARTQELLKNQALFKAVVSNSPTKIHIKDVEGRYILINQEAEKLFGVSDEEGRGKTSYDLFPEEVAGAFVAHDQSVITTGEPTEAEEQFVLEDGIHTFLTIKFPIYNQDGISGVGAIGTDITEIKQTQEALILAKEEAESANKYKSEFLAAMSHDLRTPLNAIIGFAEIIHDQYFGSVSGKYQEYAQDIHSSGDLLLSLVNDILDLSALESGKIILAKETITVTDIITECETIIKKKAQSFGIDLETMVSRNLPPLSADRRAVMQILLNLLSNAVKFTPEGGKITLQATATKEHLCLEVIDTGVGIPSDRIATVTDPFVKGETDPHKAQESTGLGLAIVKSLTTLHDGQLDIKSSVDEGTTVIVKLPL